MLFSSTGIVLNKHFCQNQLKSFAFFVKAENCHSLAKLTDCPFHKQAQQESSQDKKKCCDDESEYLHNDQDLQNQLNDFEKFDFSYNIVAIQSPITEFVVRHKYQKTLRYLSYRPPIVSKDIVLLFQSYLI